jgi:predicted XRE-type DNA-binding protein
MSNERFASVWDAIEETPDGAHAMSVRASLMQALTDHVSRDGLDEEQAARAFGVGRSVLADLVNGDINRFSLDDLVSMAVHAGLHVEVRVSSSDQAA